MARRRRSARGARAGTRARTLLKVLLVLLGSGVAAVALGLVILWPRCRGSECPSVEALRTYEPPQSSQVFDRAGKLVTHLGAERRTVVPLEKIPANVSGAFLAVEDKRFYRHRGVDWRRAAGALGRDVKSMSWEQGFSTVTMQLARNVFPEHLSRAKTVRRKVWEVVLARRIEKAFTKDQILEMYLNQIYLGQGLYGVEAAARGYFGKPVSQLTDAQAALLAALPRAPSYYDPRRNPAAALDRRNLVLRLMAESGVVTAEEAGRARAEPLGLAPPPEARGDAPYFIAAVRRELRERFGPDAEQKGLRVYTTLDRELQAAAERELVRQIQSVERGAYGRFRGPACAGGAKQAEDCLQGMFTAMDPRTGDVWALVGGRDYAMSQFDRATQARRQAGSAFKPFVFAAAIADGVPVSTTLIGPDAVDSVGGYRPRDHVSDSANVDLRDALRLSSNRATVVLGERVGVTHVVQTAKDLGITTPIQPYPSTFLGAADVVPLEMVAAYSAFAAEGMVVRPRLIRRVEGPDGRVLYESRVVRRSALSPAVAFVTTSLMRDVVDRGTGSGVRAAGLPYAVPAAGKTGTTNEGADVWFIGVTPDLVAGVWLGFDRPRAILANASGGGLAAPVWGRVVAGWYERHPVPVAWSPPADLAIRRVDHASGLLATPNCPYEDVVQEYYIPGTEPVESCPLHPAGFEGWFERTIRGIGGWISGKPEDERGRGRP